MDSVLTLLGFRLIILVIFVIILIMLYAMLKHIVTYLSLTKKIHERLIELNGQLNIIASSLDDSTQANVETAESLRNLQSDFERSLKS
jgi:predicted PurR-regulated permease PerM